MRAWEKLFDSVALARAKAIDSSRVTIVNKNDTSVDAAILGTERTEVSIVLKNNMPVIMRCKCPKARSGRKCEHMAAVLYKLDKGNQNKESQIKENQNKESQNKENQNKESPIKAQVHKTKDKSDSKALFEENPVQDQMDIDNIQKMWESMITGNQSNESDTTQSQENKSEAAVMKTAKDSGNKSDAADVKTAKASDKSEEQPVIKKRGRKSKAQLEAERLAAEEAQKQAKKEETEKRIADRKAQKAAQKAERKRKRAAAQEAQKKAREEETRRKEEELKRQQEEFARKAMEEEQKRKEEEARKEQQEKEAMRKKEEKVKAAIARKNEAKREPESAVKYQYYDIDAIIRGLNINFPSFQ